MQEELKKEIEEFRLKAKSYINKEITLKEFKGYSGGFGSYGERGGNSFMLRLRMNQGRLTKDKLKFVIDSAKNYKVKKMHFTTCETIQFHNLDADSTADIMLKALDHNIICRGGGGDYPRNVMANPLSDVEKDTSFDVLPYAKECGKYLIKVMKEYKLPRKLKVVFENSKENITHATFRDLGFIANKNNLFSVYICGGLGQNPKMGVKITDEAKPEEVLYYAKAMILTFIENGNYTNRAKARTRYMQETLGVEGLINAYNKNLAKVKNEGNLSINIEEEKIIKIGTKLNELSERVLEQKQENLYTVKFHPLAGDITLNELENIYEAIKDLDAVEVRIGANQNIYIINLSGNEVENVLKVTDFGAKNIFEESVTCVGATICQVGLRDSHGLLLDLIKQFRQEKDLANYLPKINISGCPSSCGTHQIGQIGFQGSFKLVNKVPEPAFILSVNGNELLNNEVFGTSLGTILQTDVFPFLFELANVLKEKKITFKTYLTNNYDEFINLVNKYI